MLEEADMADPAGCFVRAPLLERRHEDASRQVFPAKLAAVEFRSGGCPPPVEGNPESVHRGLEATKSLSVPVQVDHEDLCDRARCNHGSLLSARVAHHRGRPGVGTKM